MALGARYYDKLVEEYRTWLSMSARDRARSRIEDTAGDQARSYYLLYQALTSLETKRILFDARQAEIFSETAEALPHHVQRRLHLPFNMFYMEFTEPVLIVREPQVAWDANFGPMSPLTLNLGKLGHKFFAEVGSADQLALFLHELAHALWPRDTMSSPVRPSWERILLRHHVPERPMDVCVVLELGPRAVVTAFLNKEDDHHDTLRVEAYARIEIEALEEGKD